MNDPRLRLPTQPLAKRLLLLRIGDTCRNLCLAVLNPHMDFFKRIEADQELQRRIEKL